MKKKIRKFIEVLIFPIFKVLGKIVISKKNRYVFGAWVGNGYLDNSKYLIEYLAKKEKDLELIFITDNININKKHENIKVIKKETLQAYYYIATAKVVLTCHDYADLSKYYCIGRAYRVQLWHGVAFKKIGYDALKIDYSKNLNKLDRKIFNFWHKDNLYIAPSVEYKGKLSRAYDVELKNILEVGQPRNHKMFDNEWITQSKTKVIEEINSMYNKKYEQDTMVITYMPTFRDLNSEVFTFTNLNTTIIDEIKRCNPNKDVVIIEKSHFVNSNNKNSNDNIYTVKECDTQELLAATDILITDYSSCFFDFLILDRPIIQFVYDYEYYKNDDRGLYYTIEEVQCGPVVYKEKEMIEALKDTIQGKDEYSQYRERVRNKFIEFEDEKSCEKITDYIKNKLNI